MSFESYLQVKPNTSGGVEFSGDAMKITMTMDPEEAMRWAEVIATTAAVAYTIQSGNIKAQRDAGDVKMTERRNLIQDMVKRFWG